MAVGGGSLQRIRAAHVQVSWVWGELGKVPWLCGCVGGGLACCAAPVSCACLLGCGVHAGCVHQGRPYAGEWRAQGGPGSLRDCFLHAGLQCSATMWAAACMCDSTPAAFWNAWRWMTGRARQPLNLRRSHPAITTVLTLLYCLLRTVPVLRNRQAVAAEREACPVCWEERRGVVFGCGHSTCLGCGERLNACPICRVSIGLRIRMY